ncbi:MAG: LptA/OstA family protein [Phascolarctobacterium sp.]|nr:LptA/OstA family protein [Phascolarctobacterium sp.]
MKKKFLLSMATFACLSFANLAFAAGNFSVSADELDYNLKTGDGTAKGNVVITQDGGTSTCNSAKFNSKTKSGVLTGNVVADRGDEHIVCSEFIAHNENDVSAIGGAVVTKAGRSISADRIDYSKSRQFAETVGSWAKLRDSDGSVLNAAKIDYNMKDGIAKAYGGVTIDSPARNLTASSDSAVYLTDKANGYVELIGNATATQDGNTVKGKKLRLNNSNVAYADGDVKIHYVPKEQPATEEKPSKKAKNKESIA